MEEYRELCPAVHKVRTTRECFRTDAEPTEADSDKEFPEAGLRTSVTTVRPHRAGDCLRTGQGRSPQSTTV